MMLDSKDRLAPAPTEEEELEAAIGYVDRLVISLIRTSQDCVKILDQEARLLFLSENGQCAMEIESYDAIRGHLWSDLWPDEMAGEIENLMAIARSGERGELVAACPTARGRLKVWHVFTSPIHITGVGLSDRILSISRDVTLGWRAGHWPDAIVAPSIQHLPT